MQSAPGAKSMSSKMIFNVEDIQDYFNISSTENYTDYSYYYDKEGDTCCFGQVCDQQQSIRVEQVFIPALYSLVIVLGFLGNGLVLAVLTQLRRSWSVTDTFIMHLAVADIMLLLTLPFWAVEAASGWSFGTPLCKFTGALFKINFYCGIFLLACISLDRYLSIVHAVQMYSRRKPWVVQGSCVAVWLLCLLLSIPDWLFLQALRDDRRNGRVECVHNYLLYAQSSEEWRMGSRLLYHIVGFLLPSAIMVFCYSCILLRLNRGSQGIQKKRAIRVILALVVAFFVSWTPYNLTLMVDTLLSKAAIRDTCEARTTLDICLMATSTLGQLHCCLNPILYAFVGVKFRRHLLDLLRSMGCKLKSQVRSASRRSSVWSESGKTSTSNF
ncbi:C-X-C chemokine receptor type 3-like isoform X1 [Megalops cyprinoides]|uniref:C-X-C chemokine receptor type 3-like isoform X1 n=2 Tax=Megalops cyprinoides TaxID=118141 RepID=UPI001864F9B9|nr:C-X-C chemokine receptor type 3-like isoform X1 [Megalops cyprinoides]